MTKEQKWLTDDKGRHIAHVVSAAQDDVERVLKAEINDDDGRSDWVWVRLANGDLLLGMFPCGATYEKVSSALNA